MRTMIIITTIGTVALVGIEAYRLWCYSKRGPSKQRGPGPIGQPVMTPPISKVG